LAGFRTLFGRFCTQIFFGFSKNKILFRLIWKSIIFELMLSDPVSVVENLLKLRNACEAVYFDKISYRTVKDKFDVLPKDVKAYVKQLPIDESITREDIKRRLNSLIGMPKTNEHQQYTEKNLRDALFCFASQTMDCRDIFTRFHIPEKTLRSKRNDLLQKLDLKNKNELLQLSIHNEVYLKGFIDSIHWKGVKSLPMLSKSEINFMNILEDELDCMGYGKSAKGMQVRYKEAVVAKGEAIVEVSLRIYSF
jgi:hypothetical protein